ncbi:MAG: lysoplasmalogenase family protein [Pseudomonadota bacterium]
MIYILIASAFSALLYGAFFCNSAPSATRVILKVTATALLTLWAYLSGAPLPLVIALSFSTLGDGLLGASEKTFLLPGMAAFFMAHAAYLPLFWEHGADTRPALILAIQIALTIGGALYIRSLLPWMEKTMRWPVIGYTIIILVMTHGALRLEPALWLATIGAIAFAASDTILALELFRLKPDAPIKRYTARSVWALYYGGQAAIAWAFIHAAY